MSIPDTPPAVDHARDAGWYDLFAFLRDRRRILRDPACMLRADSGLALGPAAFARFLWIVLPLGVIGAIGFLAAWFADPPPSLFGATAQVYATLSDELDADRQAAEPVAAAPAAWPPLHRALFGPLMTLMNGAIDDATRASTADAVRTAYAEHAAALPAAERAWIARRLQREFDAGARRMKFYQRYMETGASNLVSAAFLGIATLVMAKSFRWMIRRQRARYRYADHAERVFLYYVSARVTWLAFIAVLTAIAMFLGMLYQHEGLMTYGMLANFALALGYAILYFRSGHVVGNVLAGRDPAAAADPESAAAAHADGRLAAWRLLWVYLLLQALGLVFGVVVFAVPLVYFALTG